MRCTKVRRNLNALLDGELSQGFQRRMEAHLEACPACRREKERVWELRGMLESMEAPGVRTTVSSADILRKVRSEVPRGKPCGEARGLWGGFGHRRFLRPATVLVSLAAAIALWQLYPLLRSLSLPGEPELYMVERMDLFENLDLIQDLPILEILESGGENNGGPGRGA